VATPREPVIMSAPTVSVSIPTYNRPGFVEQAIRSCLAQTYQDFEIVVSDNSTNDETASLVQRIGSSKIRYFRNPGNLGSFQNLTLAVERAQGRYIKLLMDDDLMKPRSLERSVAIMESHPRVGVVMSPLDIVDEKGQPVTPRFYLIKKMRLLYPYRQADCVVRGAVILRDFLTRIYPCCVPSGLLYRRECFEQLGSFDPSADFACDVELCMRFATHYDFYYIAEPLNSWRFNTESDTVQIHKRGLKNSVFYALAQQYLASPDVLALFPEQTHKRLIRQSYYFASKRCMLSVIAGLRSRDWEVIRNTLRTVNQSDPYWRNKLALPFGLLGECLSAVRSWLP
jgi:GT2 family glycosyltransferase